MKQPQGFKISTPAWLRGELHHFPDRLTTDEQRMQLVNTLAARNHLAGTGGPFAALVVETHTGRIVSAGVNLVLASGLSSAHAEIVALSLAQAKLHTWNLSAHHKPLELVVNWRPGTVRKTVCEGPA